MRLMETGDFVLTQTISTESLVSPLDRMKIHQTMHEKFKIFKTDNGGEVIETVTK